MIKGYKCFNNDFTNIYGTKFEIGISYSTNGKVEYGTDGNGFHFCKNLEDTLRYFDAMNEDVIIAEVIGSGKILTYDDEYNGYYDTYISENLLVTRILSHTEIIEMALNMNFARATRFIQSFRLTNIEQELFKKTFYNYINVLRTIDYYQSDNYKKLIREYK